MRRTTLFYALLLLLFSNCKPDHNLDPLPPNTVQVNGSDWQISNRCALMRKGYYPGWYNTTVRLEGSDGSSIYLSLPFRPIIGNSDFQPGTFPLKTSYSDSMVATVTYCRSNAINHATFETDYPQSIGNVQLISVDVANHTITCQVDATLFTKNGEKLEIRSGELQAIPYTDREIEANEIISVNDNGTTFHAGEQGVWMEAAKVEWVMVDPSRGILLEFSIPWNIEPGEYTLTSADGNLIKYTESLPGSYKSYSLESAKFNVEELDFCTSTIRVSFKPGLKISMNRTNLSILLKAFSKHILINKNTETSKRRTLE